MAITEIAVGEDENCDAYDWCGQPRLRVGGDIYVSITKRHAKELYDALYHLFCEKPEMLPPVKKPEESL